MYVQEWNLPLNPEHLHELASAVLSQFDGAASDGSWHFDGSASGNFRVAGVAFATWAFWPPTEPQ
jgi:hypothetical protein